MNVYHIASIALQVLYQEIIVLMLLTLLHSEQPKLHRVLAVLSAKGFKTKEFLAISYAYVLLCLKWIESKTYTISRHYPILSQTKLKGIKLRISLILPIYIYKKKKKFITAIFMWPYKQRHLMKALASQAQTSPYLFSNKTCFF